MTANKKISLQDILSKTSNKIFVVIDDAIEGLHLFKSMNVVKGSTGEIDNDKLEKLNSKILIANEVDHILSNKDFAFAYIWSGAALKAMYDYKGQFEFIINPEASQITLDLVSNISNNNASSCVFDTIAGQSFLKGLQEKTFYFSPYGDVPNESTFKEFHSQKFPFLSSGRWIKSPSPAEVDQIDDTWKRLKLKFNK